jgi:hypothetical protein
MKILMWHLKNLLWVGVVAFLVVAFVESYKLLNNIPFSFGYIAMLVANAIAYIVCSVSATAYIYWLWTDGVTEMKDGSHTLFTMKKGKLYKKTEKGD